MLSDWSMYIFSFIMSVLYIKSVSFGCKWQDPQITLTYIRKKVIFLMYMEFSVSSLWFVGSFDSSRIIKHSDSFYFVVPPSSTMFSLQGPKRLLTPSHHIWLQSSRERKDDICSSSSLNIETSWNCTYIFSII